MAGTRNGALKRWGDAVDRFWRNVERRGPDECWPWKGFRTRKGYGTFYANGRLGVATHFMLSLEGITVPQGREACHKCDYPPCVNPAHLFVGTRLDNVRDACVKGRWNRPRNAGDRNPSRKITQRDAERLREMARAEAMAEGVRLGISTAQVYAIRAGTAWK